MQRLPYPFFALKKSITFEILISFDRGMLRLQENGFNLFGIHFSQYQLHFSHQYMSKCGEADANESSHQKMHTFSKHFFIM